VEWLEVPRRSSDSLAASQAGYFSAMAHWRLNEPELAQASMLAADNRLAAYLRCGEFKFGTWHEYGRAAVIREEAEALLGRPVSPLIDVVSLDTARRQWATVRRWLNEGDRAGAEGRWTEAHDAYLNALHQPGFDWDTAESRRESDLASKMGVTFLLAGDYPNHAELSRRLLARLAVLPDPTAAPVYAKAILARPTEASDEAVRGAAEWARTSEGEADFLAWVQGMAAYRTGDFTNALEVLPRADGPGSLACEGGGLVFRAMALQKLGRITEAQQILARAERLLAEPIKDHFGDSWWNLAYCQLALDEARQLLGKTNAPIAKLTSTRR